MYKVAKVSKKERRRKRRVRRGYAVGRVCIFLAFLYVLSAVVFAIMDKANFLVCAASVAVALLLLLIFRLTKKHVGWMKFYRFLSILFLTDYIGSSVYACFFAAEPPMLSVVLLVFAIVLMYVLAVCIGTHYADAYDDILHPKTYAPADPWAGDFD